MPNSSAAASTMLAPSAAAWLPPNTSTLSADGVVLDIVSMMDGGLSYGSLDDVPLGGAKGASEDFLSAFSCTVVTCR